MILTNSEREKIEQMFESSSLEQDDLRAISMNAMAHVYKDKIIGYIFCLLDSNWVIWYNINTKRYEKPQKTSLYEAMRNEQ